MNIHELETGDIDFAGWKVRISKGEGVVLDSKGTETAGFTVQSAEQITLTYGDSKFADLALIALRSYLRYGIVCE